MKNRYCDWFSHIYVLCTMLGLLLLFSAPWLSRILLAIGACSLPIAFGFQSTDISLSYTVLSFCALLIAYFFAVKRRYLPLVIVSVVDLVLVIFYCIRAYTQKDMNAFGFAITDLIISLVLVAIFLMQYLKRDTDKDSAPTQQRMGKEQELRALTVAVVSILSLFAVLWMLFLEIAAAATEPPTRAYSQELPAYTCQLQGGQGAGSVVPLPPNLRDKSAL